MFKSFPTKPILRSNILLFCREWLHLSL